MVTFIEKSIFGSICSIHVLLKLHIICISVYSCMFTITGFFKINLRLILLIQGPGLIFCSSGTPRHDFFIFGAPSAFCGFLIRYFVTTIFVYQTTYVIRLLFTRIQMQIQSGTMFSERRASSRQRRRKSQRKTSSIYWRRPSKIKHLVCSP